MEKRKQQQRTSVFAFSRDGLAVRAPFERQRRHRLLQQHREVRPLDGGLAVLPADGRLPRHPRHRLERRQQRPREGERGRRRKRQADPLQSLYTVIHLLVVDVACVLFWAQSVCMAPNQNTQNIYHKQMNNGVIYEMH